MKTYRHGLNVCLGNLAAPGDTGSIILQLIMSCVLGDAGS